MKSHVLSFVIFLPITLIALGAQAADTLRLKPGDNLADSIRRAPESTVIIIGRGIHRMHQIFPRNRQMIIGEDGAVLNGSMVVSEFSLVNSVWSARVPHFTVTIHPKPDTVITFCRQGFPRCTHAVDLYVDNKPLHHVDALTGVDDTSWYFDYDADRIYLGINPTGRTIELSKTSSAFEGDWNQPYPGYVTIRNLIIEKYANLSQHGVIKPQQCRNWRIVGCTIRLNHGAAVSARHHTVVESCLVADNGQIGVKAAGDSSIIRYNEIARNNFAGYESGWEAGGSKFVRTMGLKVIGNHVHHNDGPGFWTDIDNRHALYDSNIVNDNAWAGIFHEISYEAIIRNNTVFDNGNKKSYYHGSQILVANSSGAEVHHNKVINNASFGYAITVIQQNRTGPDGFYYAVNNYIHHNDIPHKGMHGFSGGAGQHNPDTFFLAGANRFDYNDYHVPAIQGSFWRWKNGEIGWESFRAAGQEAHGTLSSLNDPVNIYTNQNKAGLFKPLHSTAVVPRILIARTDNLPYASYTATGGNSVARQKQVGCFIYPPPRACRPETSAKNRASFVIRIMALLSLPHARHRGVIISNHYPKAL